MQWLVNCEVFESFFCTTLLWGKQQSEAVEFHFLPWDGGKPGLIVFPGFWGAPRSTALCDLPEMPLTTSAPTGSDNVQPGHPQDQETYPSFPT